MKNVILLEKVILMSMGKCWMNFYDFRFNQIEIDIEETTSKAYKKMQLPNQPVIDTLY